MGKPEMARDRIAEIMKSLGEEPLVNDNPTWGGVHHYSVKIPGGRHGKSVFYVIFGGTRMHGKEVLAFPVLKSESLEKLSANLGVGVRWCRAWEPLVEVRSVEVEIDDFFKMTNAEQTRFVESVIAIRKSLVGKMYH